MAAGFPLGRQLPVDLSGYGLNQLDGLGNLRVPELRNIPVENSDFRIHFLPAHPGVFHEHLLLHNRPGEYGVDEIPVELGVALGGAAVLFHEPPQPLSGFLRHGCVGLPLLFAQIHGLAVQLKLLLRFFAVLLQLLLPLHLLLGLTADLLLRQEKAVEHPVKGNLLLPGFGVDGAQGGFHPLPVVHAQGDQQPGGVLRLLGADA